MRTNLTNFFVIGANPFCQRLSAFYSRFVEIVWFRIPKSARVELRTFPKTAAWNGPLARD